jgi:hypothetical protein
VRRLETAPISDGGSPSLMCVPIMSLTGGHPPRSPITFLASGATGCVGSSAVRISADNHKDKHNSLECADLSAL